MDLLPLLQQQHYEYPEMTAQDCVKLIYQAVLGPKHLGQTGSPKAAYIINEMNGLARRDIPLLEPIGNGLYRLNLDSSLCRLRPETIHGLFIKTAQDHQGSLEQLQQQLSLWKNSGMFPEEEAAAEIRKLCDSHYAPVSHSEAYHQAYDPHYRLVKQSFTRFIPLLEAIDRRVQQDIPTFLALEGRCASGKSTLSQLLAEIYGCSVIHMDDFFLPFPRKTPERLAEPGGNVDRERFYEEVILPVKDKRPFSYGVYDCGVGAITDSREVKPGQLLIVEGSYCLHPLYQDDYDLKAFLTCSPERQVQRILERNGPRMLERFLHEWIPMEEQYFSTFSIAERCDFVICTD